MVSRAKVVHHLSISWDKPNFFEQAAGILAACPKSDNRYKEAACGY